MPIMLENPRTEDYQNLAGFLNSFSEITQIDALFFSLSGTLVHDNTVYVDDKIIQQELSPKTFNKYAIFPITLNQQLWGFAMCNSSKVSQQRINLSKEYLENLFTKVFEDRDDMAVTVWSALSLDEMSQINYLSVLLHSTTNFSLPTKATEEQTPLRSVPENAEAYESMKAATTYICKHINFSVSLNDVANHVFLSPSYLSRLFKRYLHVNFIDYINHQKIAKAQEELVTTRHPISMVSTNVGFSQTSYFTKTFKKITSMTPSEFRQKNSAIQKIYTIPHSVDWHDGESVFDISKRYFKQQGIEFYYQASNGILYVNSIGELTDSTGQCGWLFTVDGQQPSDGANNTIITDKSVVQWIYTNFTEW